MILEKINYESINEVIYKYQLDNGLKVIIIPKKGFNKTFVYFGTKYGSLANIFIPHNEKNFFTAPLGIAHFLEHKMFAIDDKTDAMNLFAELGLDVNAYTDYTQTVYLFSGTSNINKGINLLLDFVQKPYFTDENVESEKEIIEQELKMYMDTPSDCLHNGLMQNMFENYALKYDIGGTIESIKQINKDYLYKCYNTFYNPGNMEMTICGDVNPEEIIEIINNNQSKKQFNNIKNIETKFSIENNKVNKKSDERHMEINNSLVSIGIKIPYKKYSKNECLLEEILLRIVLNASIGSSTNFYQKLLDDKLVLTYFRNSVYIDGNCGYIKVSADTNDKDELIKRVSKKLLKLNNIKINEKTFNRFKRATMGGFIKSLNSPEYIASSYMEYDFKNCELFEIINLIDKLTIEDAKKMSKYFDVNALTTYTILPN